MLSASTEPPAGGVDASPARLVDRIAECERKVRLHEALIGTLIARVDWIEQALAKHLDVRVSGCQAAVYGTHCPIHGTSDPHYPDGRKA